MSLLPPPGVPLARARAPTLFTKASLCAVAVAVVVGVLAAGDGPGVTYFSDAATALSALTAALLCVRAAGRNRGTHRRFWLLFGVACGLWGLTETIWTAYDVAGRDVPLPSWADLGYLSAIPVVVAALVLHPAARTTGVRRARRALDSLLLAAALLLPSWTLVLGPVWRTADLSHAGGAVALAYLVGDVVMLFFVVLVARRVGGTDRVALWCLIAGLLAMTQTDSAYVYLTEVTSYTRGSVVDAGWVVAYLAIALGASCSDGVRSRETAGRRNSAQPALASLVAPFVPVLASLTLIAVEIQLGKTLDDLSWALAFALVGLVLTRQVVVVVDMISSRGRHRAGARLAYAAIGERHPEKEEQR